MSLSLTLSLTELSVPHLDLTGGDQVVNVIESFLYGFAYRHQAMVPQDEHLRYQGRKKTCQ